MIQKRLYDPSETNLDCLDWRNLKMRWNSIIFFLLSSSIFLPKFPNYILPITPLCLYMTDLVSSVPQILISQKFNSERNSIHAIILPLSFLTRLLRAMTQISLVKSIWYAARTQAWSNERVIQYFGRICNVPAVESLSSCPLPDKIWLELILIDFFSYVTKLMGYELWVWNKIGNLGCG